MEPFPIAEKRTLRALIIFRFIPVKVFCHCQRADHYGSEMFFVSGFILNASSPFQVSLVSV